MVPRGKTLIAAIDALLERGRIQITDPVAHALLATLLRCMRFDGGSITRVFMDDLGLDRADLFEALDSLADHVMAARSSKDGDIVGAASCGCRMSALEPFEIGDELLELPLTGAAVRHRVVRLTGKRVWLGRLGLSRDALERHGSVNVPALGCRF